MSGYKFVRFVGGIFAKLFYRIEYHGRENEPMDGGFIAIANHSSLLDPIAVACALKRPIFFMGKSDFLKSRFMKWLFDTCNVVPVNRGESDMAALRKTCDIVKRGDITGIFPQGTRIECDCPDSESAMPGIGLIAMRTKAPMLPIAICYGKKNKKPKIFRKVHVYIGKPVPYEDYMSIDGGDKPSSVDIAKYAFSKVCDIFAENNHE